MLVKKYIKIIKQESTTARAEQLKIAYAKKKKKKEEERKKKEIWLVQ